MSDSDNREVRKLKTKFQKDYEVQGGNLRMTLVLSDPKEMDKEKLRSILGDIAQKSRNFYLSAGEELNKLLS